jgi:acyl-CoA synthetase (NDP forming)
MDGGLEALFRPRTVALVGASANPAKLSNVALRNLLRGQFKTYPVNPREEEILGVKCYHAISDIPEKVDLAIISLPAKAAVESARECAAASVRAAIVTSSGFKETGPEGASLERDLTAALQGSGTRLLGPNTLGILVPSYGLDTLFIPVEKSRRPGAGPIAMFSQSGAVSVAFLERAEAAGLGVSACVGLGNKADIDENELLEHFGSDPSTECIAVYLESFSDGREFMEVAGKVSRLKPIVLLKSGRTESGSLAASSHTGALAASSDRLVDGALRQAGVVRVYDEEELLDIAKVMAYIGHIEGDRICVVASAGGFGVIATDLVESKEHGAGLRMARLAEETKRELAEVMPAFSSVRNPVDLTAAVTDGMYDAVLGILRKDDGIDGIMMSLELQPPSITDGLVDVAARHSGGRGPPLVISAFGGDRTSGLLHELEKRRVVAYPTIWRAVRALGALAERGTYLRREK